MTRGIHWFRNDLRLHDNLGLTELADRVEAWLPVFIVDPALIDRADRDAPRVRFLFDCVAALEESLSSKGIALQIVEGQPERILPELLVKSRAEVVSWNRAPTPLGRRRDARVTSAIRRSGGESIEVDDHTVFTSDEIRTRSGGHYSVYSPYRNEWWRQWERMPRFSPGRSRFPRSPLREVTARKGLVLSSRLSDDDRLIPRGGEARARRRLRAFLSGPASRYHLDRDRPELDGTSRLSPHLRFGTISPRRCVTEGLRQMEVDPASREGISKWLDELVWREFYHAILDRSPRVLGHSFKREYDDIQWTGRDAHFEAWCDGRTGYPFVDAGMRQLRATGWMHNRVRMVVASFLTKDLLIDWRRGERFFAENLVDWDPASNNGGWQWCASTGTDAQPYFRIFNPVAQGRRWDADGVYVRRWVPELRSLDTRWVHAPWEAPDPCGGYPDPIVDHAVQRKRAIAEFERVRGVER